MFVRRVRKVANNLKHGRGKEKDTVRYSQGSDRKRGRNERGDMSWPHSFDIAPVLPTSTAIGAIIRWNKTVSNGFVVIPLAGKYLCKHEERQ
jgi:hypothetical protein